MFEPSAPATDRRATERDSLGDGHERDSLEAGTARERRRSSGGRNAVPETAPPEIDFGPVAEPKRPRNGPPPPRPRGRRRPRRPIVIAHRGASGVLPEHTLPAYARAIEMGADAIEVDLVATADGRLIARHEPELSLTTDAADRPLLWLRRRASDDGAEPAEELMAHDLVLGEARSLRARQRVAGRPREYDDLHAVPSLAQILALTRRMSRGGEQAELHLELKDPARHAALGLALEDELLRDLGAHGWKGADAPVIVQSFDAACLRALHEHSELPLLQLIDIGYDAERLLSSSGLDELTEYVIGFGISRRLLDEVGPVLLEEAHARGLLVHAYTYSDDADDDLGGPADAFAVGVDGVITDHPASAVAARPAQAI
jgi:glycerophosphoryl diester phosphodiesterase